MKSTRPFAVALIAGGRSTRMGCDKGRLPGADGVELWRSRLAILRELGAGEVMISCRPDQEHFAESGARLVFDRWPDSGPMGGIVSCLEEMDADRLVVLGVDMPAMIPSVLEELLEVSRPGQGAVFQNGQFFEPLAAVYGRAMAAEGRQRLVEGNRSLQAWLRWAQGKRLVRETPLPEKWAGCLRNVNSPSDGRV